MQLKNTEKLLNVIIDNAINCLMWTNYSRLKVPNPFIYSLFIWLFYHLLILSVYLCPKVITLSALQCISVLTFWRSSTRPKPIFKHFYPPISALTIFDVLPHPKVVDYICLVWLDGISTYVYYWLVILSYEE
jgi:hypothetical protein